MKSKDEKKYHGFLTLPRHSKLLLHEIGYDLFGFYVNLVMLAIWHRKKEEFGRITQKQHEIAKALLISQSTVSRRLKELEKHKYYVVRRGEFIILGYFPLFLYDVSMKMYNNHYANTHELYADMHRINAELQENYAKMQEVQAQKAPQRVYHSFKDDSRSFEKDVEYDV